MQIPIHKQSHGQHSHNSPRKSLTATSTPRSYLTDSDAIAPPNGRAPTHGLRALWPTNLYGPKGLDYYMHRASYSFLYVLSIRGYPNSVAAVPATANLFRYAGPVVSRMCREVTRCPDPAIGILSESVVAREGKVDKCSLGGWGIPWRGGCGGRNDGASWLLMMVLGRMAGRMRERRWRLCGRRRVALEDRSNKE
jgi:hypothetical protein